MHPPTFLSLALLAFNKKLQHNWTKMNQCQTTFSRKRLSLTYHSRIDLARLLAGMVVSIQLLFSLQEAALILALHSAHKYILSKASLANDRAAFKLTSIQRCTNVHRPELYGGAKQRGTPVVAAFCGG